MGVVGEFFVISRDSSDLRGSVVPIIRFTNQEVFERSQGVVVYVVTHSGDFSDDESLAAAILELAFPTQIKREADAIVCDRCLQDPNIITINLVENSDSARRRSGDTPDSTPPISAQIAKSEAVFRRMIWK